jgi:hypothetical protein
MAYLTEEVTIFDIFEEDLFPGEPDRVQTGFA